jgi:hypothetical protein
MTGLEDASPTEDAVALVDLADELGTRKQTLFKIAKRLGIPTETRREAARRNQFVAVVSVAQSDDIRADLLRARRQGETSLDGAPIAPDEGSFYLIQLEPDFDPGRFKVGFTTDLEGRLRHHRCSAPFAVYRKTWPCRRTWERAVIDCLTVGLVQLHTEVFRTDSLDEVLAQGDRFFTVMPTVGLAAEPGDEDE